MGTWEMIWLLHYFLFFPFSLDSEIWLYGRKNRNLLHVVESTKKKKKKIWCPHMLNHTTTFIDNLFHVYIYLNHIFHVLQVFARKYIFIMYLFLLIFVIDSQFCLKNKFYQFLHQCIRNFMIIACEKCYFVIWNNIFYLKIY